MQLMCDAITVLGSRHGILLDPTAQECRLIRFERFTDTPRFHLRAGAIIDGEEITFPFCPDAGGFAFLDQRSTPCTIALIGLHASSGTKVKLTIATPFRPQDADFSTLPILGLRLEASSFAGNYRWDPRKSHPDSIKLFLEVKGLGRIDAAKERLDIHFTEQLTDMRWIADDKPVEISSKPIAQHDALVPCSGTLSGTRFEQTVQLGSSNPETLDVAWCSWNAPVLEINKQPVPFRYAKYFSSLTDVCDWARANPTAIFENAAEVDSALQANNFPKSLRNLLDQTLHSWLANTWWCTLDGEERFSVWEGACYFHSTVDVEFTQAPFYLALWPELLGYQLAVWPAYTEDGEKTLGARGSGTRYLNHDMGQLVLINGTRYGHPMEIEENSNYLLMSYAYWRRSGDDSILQRHADTHRHLLKFILAADTTGNGVADRGVANTIDDASPAVQYGEQQTYLAAKSLAALVAGEAMMAYLDDAQTATACREQAERCRQTLNTEAWGDGHFTTLVCKSGKMLDPRSGEMEHCPEIPGWDAAHIYTPNALGLLDMVGLDTDMDREKLTADLHNATRLCLREYGCCHSSFDNPEVDKQKGVEGLWGAAANPGWLSMNFARDIAAIYRGVDLRFLFDRYWEWQVVTNTQEPKLFFETFGGNNLCFYPRGVGIWGLVDALAGRVIDRVNHIETVCPPFAQVESPKLLNLFKPMSVEYPLPHHAMQANEG